MDGLMSRSVLPADPQLPQLRSNCRRQLAQGPQPATAQPLPYSVDGLALGGQVRFESNAYKQYQCAPSEKFAGFTWCHKECHKEETKNEPRGEITLSNSILHTPDGTAWYVNKYIEPALFAPNEVQSEIDRLSAKFGERAHEFRMPEREGRPNAVIAVWGKIQLEPLDPSDVSIVAAGGTVKGLLVGFLGDLQRSATLGATVYRLAGGGGFLWAATYNQDGRGVLRFLTIDASQIGQSQSNGLTFELHKPMSNWGRQVIGNLSQNKRYPADALSRREQGMVIASYTIDRGGNLLDSHIKQSSGSASLDREVLDLLKRTQPFPPLPSDYSGTLTFTSLTLQSSRYVAAAGNPVYCHSCSSFCAHATINTFDTVNSGRIWPTTITAS
jgi:TonB family protein